MYTTRPLALYKNTIDEISLTPDGPNSGYLVLQDDESTPTCCFGLCKNPAIENLPFPQNKLLSIDYYIQTGTTGYTSIHEVYLIPVINQPLSSNTYYIIKADGKHKGKAYASSQKDNQGTFCFCCPYIRDVEPRPFDPEDKYQKFEFSIETTCSGCKRLEAKSIAQDGYPPNFLRRQGWRINAKSPKNFTLGEAQGIDSSLRAQLPDFNFPLSQECSKSLVVGKWYCPFMFIKEWTEKDQIKKSVFYEMTLEQRWERIFASQQTYDQGQTTRVDVVITTEMVKISGQEAVQEERDDGKGMIWFKTIDGRRTEEKVGLSSLIVKRMKWEEERVGWIKEKDNSARVVQDEEYHEIRDWRSFGCYVLVESFVLKRTDGSIVLTYDFKHTHQTKSKLE